MNYLRKLAVENKKLAFYLVAFIALGAFALMLGRFIYTPSDDSTQSERPLHEGVFYLPIYGYEEPQGTPRTFLYERALEERLEEFLSLVEGAGQVRVMVSPMSGREMVFATDTDQTLSYTTEQDSEGGSRETRHQQSRENTVMISDRQGTDRPLVLREIEPRIEGIVIIAEGGDSPFVRDALTRAARAVLGLDAHMIQVLTMTMEG
ncbi:MAG: hypothetical protein FWE05_05290 [Defluviitaleaceae bacterium]|nr:hypothetical protein [Defluviitaleaceae bacterium]